MGRPFEDDELVELLDRRARQIKVDPNLLARTLAIAASEPQVRSGTVRSWARSVGRARHGAAALVAAAAVVSLVGAALFVGGEARPTPSPAPSGSPQAAETTSVRFTSVEFLRRLREQPAAFLGHTVLVDGSLYEEEFYLCPAPGCPRHFGSATAGDASLVPVDKAVSESIPNGTSGTFAIDVRSPTQLALLGAVRLSPSHELWRPSALRTLDATASDLFPVDGTLDEANTADSCPVDKSGHGWCPPTWIGDEAGSTEPGVGGIPGDAVQVPGGSAHDVGISTLPARRLFLLRRVDTNVVACVDTNTAATDRCAMWSRWTIVDRLDPVTVAVRAPSAGASPNGIDEPAVLSEAALKRELDDNASGLVGKVVLVRGSIQTAKPCKGVNCPTGVFESLGSAVGVFDGGDQPNFPVSGVLAVRIVDTHAVRFVGRIVPNDQRLAWRPLELARYGPPDGAGLYAVTGWFVPEEAHTCPPDPTNGQGVCDRRPAQLVDDEATARTLLGGQRVESLMLHSVAGGVAPKDAEPRTYLVRAATIPPCGPNADCAIPSNAPVGLIVDARVDVIAPPPSPRPTPSATARATELSPSLSGYLPGGIVRSVDGEPVLYGLDTQIAIEDSTDATPFLIGGWFDSHFLVNCSGRVGQDDPNPLGRRSCSWILLDGGPRDLYFPPELDVPDGDAPIVLRVHTHDPSADSCLETDRAFCRSRPVIDGVVWFGDQQTRGEPIGPAEARRRIESLRIAEGRRQPDGSIAEVAAHQFVTPHLCADPAQTDWPPDIFAIHGDPRLGLVAVFPSTQARVDFMAVHPVGDGVACLGAPDAVVWAGEPSWVVRDNVLLLSFGDTSFDQALTDALANSNAADHPIAFADPNLDLAGNTVWDFVEGRAFGELDATVGYRLAYPHGPDVLVDADHRARRTALFGTITALDGPVTEARVGSDLWKRIQETKDWRLFSVHYPGATDPSLADETFVAVHVSKSTFMDWELLRVDP